MRLLSIKSGMVCTTIIPTSGDQNSIVNVLCKEKYTLKQADLGEKKVVFKLNGDYAHLEQVLLESFPLLEKAGGFELHQTGGPYSRKLETIDLKHLTSVARLKAFVEQARVYIRPV